MIHRTLTSIGTYQYNNNNCAFRFPYFMQNVIFKNQGLKAQEIRGVQNPIPEHLIRRHTYSKEDFVRFPL